MTLTQTPGTAGAPLAARSTEQLHAPYVEALLAYGHRAPQRLHVPGHGGGAGADPALFAALGASTFQLDIPQDIEGVDIGARPTPYERAETLAAAAYGAGRTWFLTNGATQGNQAICLALTPAGTAAVVQRNCHGSVIDGLVLSGGSPTYVTPGYDAGLGMATVVTPDSLRAALRERPDARVAMLVSPTYFGMVADVAGCAEVAREAGVTLVVDCAWGPHFGFHPALPDSPLRRGADVALTSIHKHAGSLTQSAMLHVAPDREQLTERIGRAVRLLRSTSPSSLLLASLDAARRQLVVRGARVLGDAIVAGERLRERVEEIDGCQVLDRSWNGPAIDAWDPLRVVVDVRGTGVPATTVAALLRDVHDVQPELSTHTSIVFVIPLGMTATTAEHVADALREAVADGARGSSSIPESVLAAPPSAERPRCSPREAFLGRVERVRRSAAIGRLSAEAISAYPPGIPALLPGEPITRRALDQLLSLHAAGLRLHGASDPDLNTLVVTAES
ncbi:aminotransferase class I/II-fold pyridoxal phosphate-dependent enzyme [Conexibacter sp. CPCC 206217]|uniref:aminotransferase class I/II-fold pyridoxal phosphate-dependent enzyme n=1 Tax=Conexibacter sp. CPCC 206217 TaxID=3064574 RepID=UPI002728558D|nr:amino acid decarboxylase [Conexibacter sp. CPCC 206217]MDO8212273.1 amino acid decarboxylase [Conexibacter sp. CPCC 206217]